MNDLIGKISSYHLFNYLFTGVLFVVLAEYFTPYQFIQNDLFMAAFFYYFIGLILSRIGSLFIEPILRKISFLHFTEYEDYVSAAKKDGTIEILSETNNMYRTLTALFATLIVLKLYGILAQHYQWLSTIYEPILILGLALMFLFSYRKQTAYISKRISNIINNI